MRYDGPRRNAKEQSGAARHFIDHIDEALIQRKTAKILEGDESQPERNCAPSVRFLLQALGGASVGSPGGAFSFPSAPT